jgi:hypothetical protein
MAKRKSSDGEGLNLDSLMDALTNVVAVLILVLLLVNADATNTIIKYFTDLEPATPEEVQQSQAKVDKLIEQKEQVQQIFQQEPPKPEEIETAKQRIRVLEMELKIQQKDIKTMSDLQKELVVAESNRDKEKEIVVAMQEEIAKIKSQLDTTEIEEPKDNVLQDIQIPEMKGIPENATVYTIDIAGKKIASFNVKPIIEEIEKAWKDNKKDLFLEKIKPDKKYIDVYDQLKSKAFLDSFLPKVKNNPFGLNLRTNMPTWVDWVGITISPNPNGGMVVEDLEKTQNILLDALRKISADRNAVLFFQVAEDSNSFLTYSKTREYVEKMYPRMLIGWGFQPKNNNGVKYNFVNITLDNEIFRVKPTGKAPVREAPKPDPNAKPTPPPTKRKLG